MTDRDDRILELLGQLSGKVDRLLSQSDGHDQDIDELRRGHAELVQTVTVVRTTLRLVWGVLAAIVVLIGTAAAVVQALH